MEDGRDLPFIVKLSIDDKTLYDDQWTHLRNSLSP